MNPTETMPDLLYPCKAFASEENLMKNSNCQNTETETELQEIIHCPVKSKVSTRLAKNFAENDNDNNSKKSTSEDETEVNQEDVVSYHIKVNLVFRHISTVMSVDLELSQDTIVEDVIKRSIFVFNDGFSKDNSLFRLNGNWNNYTLKPSKKSRVPKTDMPAFDNSAKLFHCCTTVFSLLWKGNPENYEAYFYDLIPKQPVRQCRKCNIL